MTADAEPPREIEELEQIVRTAQDHLGRTSYLPKNAHVFLEEIAHRCGDGASRTTAVLDVAAASARIVWPPGLSAAERRDVLGGLLGGSGAFAAENGSLRFARPAVQEYLAARHVFRRHPHGPRQWDARAWKYLAPRTAWPWPEAGVHAFLAALWWPVARATVERRLRRLLQKRHWDPNIRFVIELLRRDLVTDEDIRERTVDVLRRALGGDRLDDVRWTVVLGWAQLLDPARAADELDALVRVPVLTMTSRRRFQAVVALTEYDRERGGKALRILADSLAGTPDDRYDTAILIAERDPEVGTRAMLLLARTEDMRDRRADAAIFLGSVELLREFAAQERSLSDDARSKALAKLHQLAPDVAVTAAERFAGSAANEDTPLRIAELILPWDRQAALRIATAVAWPTAGTTGGEVRYQAVVLIGRIDTARAIPELERLSAAPSVGAEIRFRAATWIVTEYGGPIDALVALAEDGRLEWPDKARAARVVGEVDREIGARLLIVIAKAGPSTDAGRLNLLREAHILDARPAAAEIAKLAKDKRTQDEIRLRGVEIIGATDTKVAVELYASIVDTGGDKCAMTAALKVKAMHHPEGERMMARLAERGSASVEYRLRAAEEAGSHGKRALQNLARAARPDNLRLRAAKALSKVDWTSGRAAIWSLVERATPGKVRIDAAHCLPDPAVVDALALIAGDRRERDDVRFEAAVHAFDHEPKRGRKLLWELAQNPAISAVIQERAQRLLNK